MSNSFYNHGAFPSTGSAATSASMRAELDLVAAGFDKMPTLAGNANKFVIVNSTGTGLTQTDVLPAFTVTDTDFTVQDDGDNTRKFQFNAGSITTGNTRVYVMPDLDTTLVGTNVTQTLTNKTLTAPVIATIVNTGTLTLPTSTDTLIGRNTTDTLTNKTLTNPVIGTIVNTGTLTLPTSTDTLVGRQTTDTLTNKTISGASNTLSNIANGSLSNSSIVIGSTTLSLGGTMTTLAGVTISGASNTLSNIANASLTNSSITINGSTVALGSSVTVTATATNALTIGNGLSGTSYNGSSAVTIAINTGVTADLSTAQTFSNKTISGSANTLSNIANASLTNSAITIGSTAISLGATSLTLAGLTSASATTLISTGNQATSVAISAIGHSSGTVTVTTGTAHGLTTGDTASIDGVADYTFCGVYTVTVTNANVFTYSQTASGASSSGGFSTKLTGTWGLYAGGTGPSLANGPVMINASSQMPALRVTQGGSGFAFIVEDAANPDTSAFIISNAGDLAINTNKFTVAAASGNTVIAGTTSLNGNVTFATDATYDIGASGATRPRDLFLSRNLVVGGTLTLAGGVNLNGNVTIGDASTDTLTINSTITSNLIFTDNTYDIGASGATRPRNLYLAGLLTMGGALTVTGASNFNGSVTLGDASGDTLTTNTGAWTINNDITINTNLMYWDRANNRVGFGGATSPAFGVHSVSGGIFSGATATATAPTYSGVSIGFDGSGNIGIIASTNPSSAGLSIRTKKDNTTAPLQRLFISELGVFSFQNTGSETSGTTFSIDASNVTTTLNVIPSTNVAQNLGGVSNRWASVFTAAVSDGTNSTMLSSSGANLYLGNGSAWTSTTLFASGNAKVYVNTNGLGIGGASSATDLLLTDGTSILTIDAAAGSEILANGTTGLTLNASNASGQLFFRTGGAQRGNVTSNGQWIVGGSVANPGTSTQLIVNNGTTGASTTGAHALTIGNVNNTTGADRGVGVYMFAQNAAAGGSDEASLVFGHRNNAGTGEGPFSSLRSFKTSGANTSNLVFYYGNTTGSDAFAGALYGNGRWGFGTSVTEAFTNTTSAAVTVSGAFVAGQLSPYTRYTYIGTSGVLTNRFDDNSLPLSVKLQNLGMTGTGQGIGILASMSTDGTNDYNGGAIQFASVGAYSATTTTQNSEVRMLVAVNGNLTSVATFTNAGNMAMSQTDKGIDFSVNSAAAGVTSEILNDYEEGTWSPTVTYGGDSSGQTYAAQVGRYVKIGSLVTAYGYVQIATSTTATGVLAMSNLPFTIGNVTNLNAICTAYLDNAASAIDQPFGSGSANTTYVSIVSGTGANNASGLTDAVRGASFRVGINITYRV